MRELSSHGFRLKPGKETGDPVRKIFFAPVATRSGKLLDRVRKVKGKRRNPPILRSHVIQTGSAYLRVVGPAYGFFGLGMALYFASQGAARLFWPLLSRSFRFMIAIRAAGSRFALPAHSCRAYCANRIRGVVWSRANECTRLALITNTVVSNFRTHGHRINSLLGAVLTLQPELVNETPHTSPARLARSHY